MKTITLTQPWATLVAIGAKRIETRSWNTNYRGALAIHAAKGFPNYARSMFHEPAFCESLALAGYGAIDQLPRGVVVATCELRNTEKMTDYAVFPSGKEILFGDYRIGRYMWFLENVVALPEPIPAKGALSLWEWNQ